MLKEGTAFFQKTKNDRYLGWRGQWLEGTQVPSYPSACPSSLKPVLWAPYTKKKKKKNNIQLKEMKNKSHSKPEIPLVLKCKKSKEHKKM